MSCKVCPEPESLLRFREDRLSCGSARLQRSAKTVVTPDTLNTVRGVEILHKRYLVARSAALARDDGAVCEEVFPYL